MFFYSIGLFAYGSTKILQSCFFALKDTVTPTKIAGLALAINIVLNSILMFPFKIGGIALATSISCIITFFILFSILIRKLKDFKTREIFISFLRIIGASVFMGLSCFWAEKYFISISLNKVVKLFLLFLAGSVSYAVFCFLFRVSELGDLVRWVGRKRN